MVIFGSALLVYCVLDRSIRRGGDIFRPTFSGYYYSTPAKVGAAVGAGLVVAGLLLRRRPTR